jgi:hypothetical protein
MQVSEKNKILDEIDINSKIKNEKFSKTLKILKSYD